MKFTKEEENRIILEEIKKFETKENIFDFQTLKDTLGNELLLEEIVANVDKKVLRETLTKISKNYNIKDRKGFIGAKVKHLKNV